ncbi:roundabout homolog 2-like [Gigantopelta aegis]|uniref:roundabout homolog 2-like n=1 Tax=Gigantopelta aegis TaxID=1735272 RepID=UPI001B88B282|nr:roundabout homolog 2-like [Gigantopelta aegis]
MGANHSHANDLGVRNSSLDKNGIKNPGISGMPAKQWSSARGKPSPPSGVPVVTDITHNSLMLSWHPPKSINGGSILAYTIKMQIVKNREWLTLTKSCQGNNYLVKNLEPNSSYQFRVRAENIYGRSKFGHCSEIVQTNNFNFQKLPSPSTERKSPSLKRRHSVNIHVEGTVANILNHSDPVVKTSVSASALNDRNSTFQRDMCYRNSLQPTRKRSSINTILPGTKTDSLLKLKDSQLKQSSSKNSFEDITRTCSHESSIDRIESESNTDDQSLISDNFLRDLNSHNGDIDETDDSEKPISDISESASGDIKFVFSSRTASSEHIGCSENGLSEESVTLTSEHRSPCDFRTLRNMLNSSDIIIKSSRSLPEISDVYKTNMTQSHTLSTIIDEDMDDESVQVTTL